MKELDIDFRRFGFYEVQTNGGHMNVRHIAIMATIIVTVGCRPTPPIQDQASENVVSFRYHAYDSVPTLTAAALDKAMRHCARFGKFANYKGASVSEWTTEEVHTFACEDTKIDDGAVIAGQSRRPDVLIGGSTFVNVYQ